MGTSVEEILSELVIRVANHFDLNSYDALAIVAQSKIANELSLKGNHQNLTLNKLSEQLYEEIAKAK
ncbi:MAG: hypothetical protein HDR88_07205 [Bacteroides sp.]|nr:hypothetical protein [Bacteroides sp.]